jgi:APA family basic amino acid/polyamine antiporter
LVFFAASGYDAMPTAAEESKDAQRHMPKAIRSCTRWRSRWSCSMVLYVLACLVLTGMQDYTQIDPASGFSTAFASVRGDFDLSLAANWAEPRGELG